MPHDSASRGSLEPHLRCRDVLLADLPSALFPRESCLPGCAQNCAHHQTLPSITECRNTALQSLEALVWHVLSTTEAQSISLRPRTVLVVAMMAVKEENCVRMFHVCDLKATVASQLLIQNADGPVGSTRHDGMIILQAIEAGEPPQVYSALKITTVEIQEAESQN